MSNGNGFTADPAAMQAAANGIREAIGALGAIGNDDSQASEGFGLYQGALTHGSSIGHAELEAELVAFASRWEQDDPRGLRGLVKSGQKAADALNDAHKTYVAADDQATHELTKIIRDMGL